MTNRCCGRVCGHAACRARRPQYLPDFKFWTPASSQRYAKARDYPEHAREAIREMHRQVLPQSSAGRVCGPAAHNH
jgi:hypothetical protein